MFNRAFNNSPYVKKKYLELRFLRFFVPLNTSKTILLIKNVD
ncbi:hypothetical protein SPONN_1516 [uncultured Candidatus Thioglobus sp.]|nr:hypothetical protein SPONL_29 [uncultured Candidatus Thioglobus sp.]SMN00251.1 hypothetical protein SPONN_1516 [uncultured Candidatus Thioglobus sp.]